MRRLAFALALLLGPGLFGQLGAPPTTRLSNLSVRTNTAAGQTVIVGFTLSNGSKQVLLRAVGPGLAAFGLSGLLADPRINVFRGGSRVDGNDNWSNLAGTFGAVGAFPLQEGSLDAALITEISGGVTAQIPAASDGIVLVEAYEIADTYTPRLINISVRNRVGTGANILIAGFNISGTSSSATKRVLLRGVGPGLATFGVTGLLADPKLVLQRSGDNGASTLISENDDWSPALATTFSTVGAFNLTSGSKDAALLVSLTPGTYTVQLSGVGDTTGEALIEAYEVP